jgi:hypothetical protein
VTGRLDWLHRLESRRRAPAGSPAPAPSGPAAAAAAAVVVQQWAVQHAARRRRAAAARAAARGKKMVLRLMATTRPAKKRARAACIDKRCICHYIDIYHRSG